MKKIMIILLLLFIVCGCKKKEVNLDKEYTIETSELSNCTQEIYDYLEIDGQKVFLSCLDEVYLKDNENKITLSDYLNQDGYSIDIFASELSYKLVEEESISDEVRIFRDNGPINYSNNGLTLIMCNTINGNRDVYIGNDSLEYSEELCVE